MAWRLRAGTSYCVIDTRFIFLDIVADRYFGLGPALEDDFRRVTQAESPSSREPALLRLVETGLIVEGTETALAPCPVLPAAVDSFLDRDQPLVPFRHQVAALRSIFRAKAILKVRGLRAALSRIHSPSRSTQSLRDEAVLMIAGAHLATRRLIRSHDQCLPRAIALAQDLAAQNIAAELLFGVRLRPFAAHCWVQQDVTLLTDRLDPVSSYTPILRL